MAHSWCANESAPFSPFTIAFLPMVHMCLSRAGTVRFDASCERFLTLVCSCLTRKAIPLHCLHALLAKLACSNIFSSTGVSSLWVVCCVCVCVRARARARALFKKHINKHAVELHILGVGHILDVGACARYVRMRGRCVVPKSAYKGSTLMVGLLF